MEVVTGYFISRGPALEAARFLRRVGVKGEISVIGRENDEDFREKADLGDDDDLTDLPNLGVIGNATGVPGGLNAYNFAGSAPFVIPRPMQGFSDREYENDFDDVFSGWSLPREIEKEAKRVVEAGSSVVLVECESKDKLSVRDALIRQGAQNVHS